MYEKRKRGQKKETATARWRAEALGAVRSPSRAESFRLCRRRRLPHMLSGARPVTPFRGSLSLQAGFARGRPAEAARVSCSLSLKPCREGGQLNEGREGTSGWPVGRETRALLAPRNAHGPLPTPTGVHTHTYTHAYTYTISL